MPKRQTARSHIPPGCLDVRILTKAVLRDSAHVPADPRGTYDVSYPEFLEYFKRCGPLTRHHLIIAANFAYGWMPTILDFRSRDFEKGVAYLERARVGSILSVVELRVLSEIVNNSMVGASKLLHFASPENYAIWDSRVAKYLGAGVEGTQSGAAQYLAYNDCMRSMANSEEAALIVAHVSRQVGYEVSAMRALELVMFHGGLSGRSFDADSASLTALANTR